ncbi:hypothetical protein N7468_000907 [Penicillium chermesinum]|uniref:Uncharacterized protein n=1 Tax=Penicillium chermesinum TaxID=63820 RepID=A0A9W9PFV1_9EURO|nr:uncharacterized protein N7468_000907 [Penicillium chermesinum]KAJ5245924.1 hypothetical protein N7468_000907 [Penicillium chermesinum]
MLIRPTGSTTADSTCICNRSPCSETNTVNNYSPSKPMSKLFGNLMDPNVRVQVTLKFYHHHAEVGDQLDILVRHVQAAYPDTTLLVAELEPSEKTA